MIYRVKPKIITYDESDLEAPYKDIDEIIDKYSKPYEELYLDSGKEINIDINTESHLANAAPSLQLASILHSHLLDAPECMESTEIDLTYSHLPDEQLLLDSCAPIGSLISNSDNVSKNERLRDALPPVDTQIFITEKINSRSILEKFEESERLLNEENLQLKEAVERL